ncbi:hypothetical protein D9M71_611770 [compost metagenome]
MTKGLSSAGLSAEPRRIMSTCTDGKLSFKSMKASAALCPPPMIAMLIGRLSTHGCLAICARYWE